MPNDKTDIDTVDQDTIDAKKRMAALAQAIHREQASKKTSLLCWSKNCR